MNAVGQPQSIALLGGTSEIGLAIVDEYVAAGHIQRVTLLGRPSDALQATAQQLRDRGVAEVAILPFDARDIEQVITAIDQAFDAADIDVAVLAYGVLGDQARAETDARFAADMAVVNYSSAVGAGVQVVNRLKRQGHGTLVLLSSVAGERARRGNFVYGSTKAGLDSFGYGLSDSLRGSGASVVVVRPGFVHSKMTAGLPAAPLATTPAAVAAVTVTAVRSGKQLVWAPASLRWVMAVLRHLPRTVFRRLPM